MKASEVTMKTLKIKPSLLIQNIFTHTHKRTDTHNLLTSGIVLCGRERQLDSKIERERERESVYKESTYLHIMSHNHNKWCQDSRQLLNVTVGWTVRVRVCVCVCVCVRVRV